MKTSGQISILYAEDNEDAASMLSMLLGFYGIEVLPVRSVQDALQAAHHNHFDLYLLDSRLPDGSGFDLCQQLREFNSQIPVVFYSGAAYESDKQKGLAAGAKEYLIKPNVEDVVPTIFKLVAKAVETA